MKPTILAVIYIFLIYATSAQSTFTVVNISNSGAGSLRQAIIDANAVVTTLPHTIVFNIPPGLLTSGVARIMVTGSPLPTITRPMIIDGITQTTFGGNTNTGTWGSGGTVGRRNIGLPLIERPEVEVYANNDVAYGFAISASNTTIKGLAMNGFGGLQSNSHGNIIIISGMGITIRKNTFGFPAAGPFSDPGSSSRTKGSHIIVGTHPLNSQTVSVSNVIIDSNLLAFAENRAVFTPYATGADRVQATVNGLSIHNNEIRNNGLGGGTTAGGIEILTGYQMPGSSIINLLISANLIAGQTSDSGIEIAYSASDFNIDLLDNTIQGNQLGIFLTSDFGIVLPFGGGNGGSNSSRDTIMNNIMSNSIGDAGIAVIASRPGTTLTGKSIFQNSIFNNANVGIDLVDESYAGFGATLNDGRINTTFGNDGYDYPVIVSSCPASGNLYLQMYCRPGARIELFVANPDLAFGLPTCHGEGQIFIGTLVDNGIAPDFNADGSANALAGILDDFSGTGSYSGPYGSCNEGSDSVANAALFTIPNTLLPGGYIAGNTLTSTATDLNGNTSEFGLNTLYNNCTWIILPTKLSLFRGQISKSKTQLEWITTSENGTTLFEIERSVDARSFLKLGEVKAAGHSALKLHYSFIDNDANEGLFYYRLKIINADGTFEYSSTVILSRYADNVYKPMSTLFDNTLRITGYSEIAEKMEVCIIALDGKVILRKTIALNKGGNNTAISTSGISGKGLYFLKIKLLSREVSYKIFKIDR